jgi:hypothetical protein
VTVFRVRAIEELLYAEQARLDNVSLNASGRPAEQTSGIVEPQEVACRVDQDSNAGPIVFANVLAQQPQLLMKDLYIVPQEPGQLSPALEEIVDVVVGGAPRHASVTWALIVCNQCKIGISHQA